MKISYKDLSITQQAVALSWAWERGEYQPNAGFLERRAEEFLSYPDFQENFFYSKNPEAGSFEEFNSSRHYLNFDDYISKNFSEYFKFVFGLGDGEIYIINFSLPSSYIGDHQERYQDLCCKAFEAESPTAAYDVVDKLQERCEQYAEDGELWPSDTSLYGCCYKLDDSGEMIPLRDLV